MGLQSPKMLQKSITYLEPFVPFLYRRLIVPRVCLQKLHVLFRQTVFAAQTTHGDGISEIVYNKYTELV